MHRDSQTRHRRTPGALAHPSLRCGRRMHRRLRSQAHSGRSKTARSIDRLGERFDRDQFGLLRSPFPIALSRFPAVCDRLASCHRRVSMARTSYPLYATLSWCAVVARGVLERTSSSDWAWNAFSFDHPQSPVGLSTNRRTRHAARCPRIGGDRTRRAFRLESVLAA